MKKSKSLLILLPLTLASCGGPKAEDWTPDKAISKATSSLGLLTIGEESCRIENDNSLFQRISEVREYTPVSKNESTSENFFTYGCDIKGDIFPVGLSLSFYQDGYATVKTKNVDYVYTFSKSEAINLYQFAVSYLEQHK